LAWAT